MHIFLYDIYFIYRYHKEIYDSIKGIFIMTNKTIDLDEWMNINVLKLLSYLNCKMINFLSSVTMQI